MVWLAVAFAAGIGCAEHVTLSQIGLAAAVLVTLFAAALAWLGTTSGLNVVLQRNEPTTRHSIGVTTLIVCTWFLAGVARAPERPDERPTPDGLMRLTGLVREHRLVRVPPTQTRYGVADDYTRLRVAITNSTPALVSPEGVDCYVNGHVPEVDAGDTVSLFGRLAYRPPPANPGERWTRSTRTPVVYVEHPDCVETVSATGIARLRSNVRRGLSDTIRRNLSRRQAGLAETLLLGKRDELHRSLSDAFRQTGTGHLLAISGLHLGLIAWMLNAVVARATHSLQARVWIVATLVLGYALLVEPRASVIRAAVFTSLAAVAILNGRRVLTLPVLAMAAVVVLAIDPRQLTHPGAHLSFAAVAAIIAIIKFRLIERLTPRALATDEMTPQRTLRNAVRVGYQFALWGLLLWAATAPLTAYHFRWVTLWGALLHGICFPLVAIAMAVTLAAMTVELWCHVPALWAVSEACFSTLSDVVEAAASVPGLSWTVPAPAAWVVLAIYGSLLAVLLVRTQRTRRVIACTVSFACFVAVVLVVRGDPTANARVHVLSVGHGLCVLVQSPDGESLMYDVGSLGNPDRTGTSIGDAALALGVRDVDRLILSHADQDHFGAIEPVLRIMNVREALCHRTFLDSPSWTVQRAVDALHMADVPLHTVAKGDRFDVGPINVTILHPAAADSDAEDNANSLVALLEFAGRSILLTGDVEGAGQASLVTAASPHSDVLLAPHHGSLASNTREFAAWAQPKAVVVSSGHETAAALSSVYGPIPLFETEVDGAITVEITPLGEMTLRGYRGRIVDFATD